MDEQSSAVVLEQKILEDARQEAESVLARARQKAGQRLNAARSEAAMLKKTILTKARAEAERQKGQVLSAVELELRKTLLLAREKLVEEAFQRARQLAQKFRTAQTYPAKLKELIAQGVLNLDREEVEVRIGIEDYQKLGEAFASEIENYLAEKYSRRVKIRLRSDQLNAEPGASVRSLDGRLIFDNTYSARLRRIYPYLRQIVHQHLFTEDNDSPVGKELSKI